MVASTPCSPPSRRCAIRATRSSARRRTGRPIPRRSSSPVALRWSSTRLTSRRSRSRRPARGGKTDRTKAILFVSPDNPSGAVYTPAETKAIGEWAVERGVWVITDEIYEHLTYGPHEFSSMPVLVPDLVDTVRDPQRRRQDLRHDRLAGRLADRPGRRRQGGHQLPESRHLERRRTSPSERRSQPSTADSTTWR